MPRVAVVLTTCALTVTCALSLAVHARAAASLTGPPDSDDTSARSPVAANQSCTTTKSTVRLVKTCYGAPQRSSQGWVVGYRDSVRNDLSSSITGACTASTSTTVTYTLSVSASAEASAWIFAKASASVSGGLARSTTSGYSTSATFKVPARSTVSCQRGVVTQNFRSLRSTKVQYLNSKGKVIRVTTSSAPVTGKAPATAQWRIS